MSVYLDLDDLRCKAELIGLAEPLERLASWIDREYSLDIGRRNTGPPQSVSAASADSWSRWLRAQAAKCRSLTGKKDL
jgi:hypothetical protein